MKCCQSPSFIRIIFFLTSIAALLNQSKAQPVLPPRISYQVWISGKKTLKEPSHHLLLLRGQITPVNCINNIVINGNSIEETYDIHFPQESRHDNMKTFFYSDRLINQFPKRSNNGGEKYIGCNRPYAFD